MTYVEEMQFLVYLQTLLGVYQKLNTPENERLSGQYYAGICDILEILVNDFKEKIVHPEEPNDGN
jgi:hypothetical protein